MKVEHLIVGAGFAGLCTAIKLQEDGETDFLVVEKGSDVGGTWRDNTYPGAACDVPSQLYSFSFAPNPDWSMSFSPQPEIQAYLQRVARESGTLDRFTFGTALEEARWDHDADLAGKRVAVVGTGASAIQIVPEVQQALQSTGGHLDVYQRTAPWVIPRSDRPYTRLERLLLRRLPGFQRLYRGSVYLTREMLVPGLTVDRRLSAPIKAMALANLRKGVRDPGLRARLTPNFDIGCKRILISNTYYPALDSDNVELVTDRIARVTADAIVTDDGTERPVDVIVVATGFHTTDLPIAERIAGRDGRTLAEVWSTTGMAAYKGTTVPDFPNLFLLAGPNTGQGHTSMVFIIESQVEYLRDAVRTLRRSGWSAVEPTAAAFGRWNRSVQSRMRRTVWTNGGCSSWYLDEHGNNPTLWPRSTITFRRELARFDPDAYTVTSRKEHAA